MNDRVQFVPQVVWTRFGRLLLGQVGVQLDGVPVGWVGHPSGLGGLRVWAAEVYGIGEQEFATRDEALAWAQEAALVPLPPRETDPDDDCPF